MSQTTSAYADPGVQSYKSPGITVETKLMNQYRLASPVHPGSPGAAVCNKAGQVELFTVGTDGTVWNFYPDPSSDTGYRRADTGLRSQMGPVAMDVAAGVDQDGSVVVFAKAAPNALYYRVKKPDGTWSEKITAANLPEGSGFQMISRVVTGTIDGQLYVAVLGVESGPLPEPRVSYLASSNWSSTPGVFHGGSIKPRFASSGTSFWNHRRNPPPEPRSKTVVFTFFGWAYDGSPHQFYTYDQDGNLVDTLTGVGGELFAWSGATADVDSYVAGGDRIFMLSGQYAKCKVATFTSAAYDGSNKQWLCDVQFLTDQTNLTRLHAVHDHKGGTQLLCVSKDGNLYHLAPDGDSPTGYSSFGLPIEQHVTWVAVARNNDGDIEVFCAQEGANADLIHRTLDQATSKWERDTLEIQSPSESDDKLEEFISYSSDIAFRDAAGMPLANATVTVNASDRAMITVNNATFAVDAATSHSVTTDATGKLTITQETGGLSVPDLWLYTDKLIPRDHVFVLHQYANGRDDAGLPANMRSVEARLREVKAQDLMDAKDASGKPLLDVNKVGKVQTAFDDLATACQDCMKLPNREPHSSPAALHPLISRKGCWTGLHVEPLAVAAERSRVHPHPDLPSWSLTFGEDGVRHQRLTSQEAETMMAEMRANVQPAEHADGTSWWSSIGDFFASILEGAAKILKLVVHGVNAAFHFMIGTVEYVFNKAVTVVQDAFDLLESILASVYDTVVDFFKRTFEWIGFLFDWPDILRTSDALYYTIDEMFTFLKKAAPEIKARADKRFTTAHADIKAKFDEIIGRTDSTTTLDSTAKENDHHDPVLAHSLGNNVVGNAYTNNWQSAKAPASMLATVNTDDLEHLLEQFAVSTEGKPEFSKVTSAASPDKFFTEALKTLYQLLEDLILAVVDGIQEIVDKLLELLPRVIDTLQQSLKAELYIPLVSELFKSKIGRPLNGLNMIALVAAIPTTILYKAIYGAAPYPDQSSVDAFKHDFTADWMLQASGLGAKLTDRALGKVSKNDARRLQLSCAVMTAVYGSLTATLDLISGEDTLSGTTVSETPPYIFFSTLAFGLEVGLWACSCPWIYEVDPAGWAIGVWSYQFLGIGLDCYFLYKSGTLPENDVKGGAFMGIVVAGLYGLIDFVLNFLKVYARAGDVEDILPTFAEIGKFLLYKGVVKAKPLGWLAPLLVGELDALLYGISAALQVIKLKAVKLAEESPLAALGEGRLASPGVTV